jgi:CBS domain-containing protein
LQQKGSSVIAVRPDETIGALIQVLRHHNIGAAVVRARFGEVLGIISERDVMRGLAEYGADALRREVHELMTYRTISCRPEESIRDAAASMNRHNIRHLPVVDGNGSLEGMISLRDVNRVQLEQAEAETAVLRDYATVSQTLRVLR